MVGLAGELLAFLRHAEPRGRPSVWAVTADTAVAVVATVGGLVAVVAQGAASGLAGAVTITAVTLTALPLALRRLYPIMVWLTIAAAIFAVSLSAVPPVAYATAVFAAYSAIAHSRYQRLATVTVLVVTLVVTVTFADALPRFPGRFTALLAIVPAVVAGLGVRDLQRRLNESAARLRSAAEENEATTRRAIEAERVRIAGELHDVVTHNVSMMVVQAGAARMVLAGSSAEAEAAMLAVESSGRTAMTELRCLLDLINPADEIALRPQPGLGELDALISRVSLAGLSIELHVSGDPRPLPPGADLAAYRVVQEALTNVLRHAGRARTSIRVEWGDTLVITVSDNGRGACRTAPGRGLLGLRARLSPYGGAVEAGPQAAGGWRVRAVLPVGPMP